MPPSTVPTPLMFALIRFATSIPAITGSFDELKGQLSKQAELRDQLFAQEMSSQKDRERLLAEKFKEAMKNADKDTGQPFRNPLDMD